jgi:hypothetical protein
VAGSLVTGLLANIFTAPFALLFCGGLLIPALGLIQRANRHTLQFESTAIKES